MPEILNIAVCISDGVTLSDFVTPLELIVGINDVDHPIFGAGLGDSPYRVAVEYLSPTLEPVISFKGPFAPHVKPTLTYASAIANGKQFDILWLPAGPIPDFATGKSAIPKEEIAFVKQQAPKAKYIMSVCGGSLTLAEAGVLSGKRATTNKAFYRQVVAAAPKDIEWVPKARWVIDGNIWTSSGVTAGIDMAMAFIEHLVGPKIAHYIRGGAEVIQVGADDDPFAAWHGLV